MTDSFIENPQVPENAAEDCNHPASKTQAQGHSARIGEFAMMGASGTTRAGTSHNVLSANIKLEVDDFAVTESEVGGIR